MYIKLIPNLPKSAWFNVAQAVASYTLISIFVAPVAISILMFVFLGFINFDIFMASMVLPVMIVPLAVTYMAIRQQQLKLANEALSRLAYRDNMLDCMNRHGFTSSLDIALEYATKHRPCALLVVDADHFKKINDQFGHDVGDQALKLIAEAIKSAIRSSDMLGRIGGEEFGIFLPGANDDRAKKIAGRICEAVSARLFSPDNTPYNLSVSIGGAVATSPTSFTDLFHLADQRLYAAKNAGRNRVELDLQILPTLANKLSESGAAA